jgi:hypothetical protein
VDGTEYTFTFEFSSTSLKVWVDDNIEIDITGSFSDGRVAFYNFSQAEVTYSGITAVRTVLIDVKPGSDPNSINNDGHGVIPVAILGSADFDVTQIDVSSLSLDGLGVGVKGNSNLQFSIEDVSGDFTSPEGAPDGFDDLVCQFVDDDPDVWQPGEGIEFGGIPIEGFDTINIVPQ